MMRALRVLLALAALLLVSAVPAAAEISPKALVLRQADVPTGFRVTEEAFQTKEKIADSELWALYTRWGRISGYEIRFERHVGKGASVESRADLFRRAEGSRLAFARVLRLARDNGFPGLRRSPARVGTAAGWIWFGKSPLDTLALVVWRHDRVLANILVYQLSKAESLALARKQQRRIAAALD